MVKPVNFDESGDSADLQALFDSIAAASQPPAPMPAADASGDSPELQALFDSVAAQAAEPDIVIEPETSAASEKNATQEVVFNRLGHLARKLHDALRELGYDKALEETARQIPDARERLNYIARMTEQAASRVLNACDIAKPAQDELNARIKALGARWEKMFANQLSVEEFKQLAADTRAFFASAPSQIEAVNAQLNEIMMAQDFQDLTGQVIKKLVETAQNIEAQLLQVLIEVMPEEKKAAAPQSLMNGPVIDAAGRTDVVTSQQQVDDLLESLGF
ncbi:MAG: protein phosphatase CheZ [Rhodocyclaceae bacterium]|nr:protein phosphatase CheZ [Rhodocyclaceae bacterium]